MMRNNSLFTIYSDKDNYFNNNYDIHGDEEFYFYNTFPATYFEPLILKNRRNLYEMKFEGKFYFILSEEDIDKFFISQIYLNDKTWDLIFIIQNQLLADMLLKGYDYRAKSRIFQGFLINADFDEKISYKLSDFLKEHNSDLNQPYFFVLENDFANIYNILSTNSKLLCKAQFDNYNTFFPKDYLLFLNYSLVSILLLITIRWLYLSYVFKSSFNDLHKWFTGILILKCIFTLLIIKCLNLNYTRSKSQKDELFNEFKMIFYDTLLSAMNVMFKSFFLFIFILIFEVRKLNN